MRVNFNILYAPIFENISLLIFANGTGLYSENVLDILDVPSLSIKPFRLAHIPGLTWEEYSILARSHVHSYVFHATFLILTCL